MHTHRAQLKHNNNNNHHKADVGKQRIAPSCAYVHMLCSQVLYYTYNMRSRARMPSQPPAKQLALRARECNATESRPMDDGGTE